MKNLTKLRYQIDAVDKTIITLLERRLFLVRDVAKIKNDKIGVPFTDFNRENEIIQRLQTQTNNLVLQDAIANIYKVIFNISKSVRSMVKEPHCPFTHIGIIGDGLIGRSIAKAIMTKKDIRIKITIHNRDWRIEKYATCDLIIIATPIDTVIDIAMTLSKNQKALRPGVVIIDVASVKGKIATKFAQLNKRALGSGPIFVPTHPMGGRQECGNAYAQSTLFAGRPWIITPLRSTGKQTIAMVSSFVAYCGSLPIKVSAFKHDKLVAYISHVPGMLSKYLLDFVSVESRESLHLSGSGFELMTRIGKSDNVRMRSQIAELNFNNMQEIVDDFINYVRQHTNKTWKKS